MCKLCVESFTQNNSHMRYKFSAIHHNYKWNGVGLVLPNLCEHMLKTHGPHYETTYTNLEMGYVYIHMVHLDQLVINVHA